MKKALFIFFFLFILFLPKSSFAQSLPIGANIPFLDCGTAGAPNGTDKCCYNKPVSIDIPGADLLKNVIPGVGGAVSDVQQKSEQLKAFQEANQQGCLYGSPSAALSDPSCTCVLKVSPTPIAALSQLCNSFVKGDEKDKCNACTGAGGYWSGIGCIPVRVESFISDFLLTIAIGFAGLTALFCIIYSVLRIQSSRGNPEVIKKAQENLTSCIIGLILVIFSVFLLRFIGISILRIPGFGQ